ncbi:hypothetical protein L2E82_30508 [Cichorium intybus]|uniref:Uncharacterized protein n=1 Tax=Cichorium intybus TaxID=13427 RepID=A0ACB9D0X7_CICIN|nr:hypothetical protein L2E82_30508 [Cichorium intybus]
MQGDFNKSATKTSAENEGVDVDLEMNEGMLTDYSSEEEEGDDDALSHNNTDHKSSKNEDYLHPHRVTLTEREDHAIKVMKKSRKGVEDKGGEACESMVMNDSPMLPSSCIRKDGVFAIERSQGMDTGAAALQFQSSSKSDGGDTPAIHATSEGGLQT